MKSTFFFEITSFTIMQKGTLESFRFPVPNAKVTLLKQNEEHPTLARDVSLGRGQLDIKESFTKNLYKLFYILNCKHTIIHCHDLGCPQTVESPPTVIIIILWSIPLPCINFILLSTIISACSFGFDAGSEVKRNMYHICNLEYRKICQASL